MIANRRLIALMVASVAFSGTGLIQPAPAAEPVVVPMRKAVRIASVPNRAPALPRIRMVSRSDLPWGIGSCTYCRGFLFGVGFGF
jgi:hypothetical protein